MPIETQYTFPAGEAEGPVSFAKHRLILPEPGVPGTSLGKRDPTRKRNPGTRAVGRGQAVSPAYAGKLRNGSSKAPAIFVALWLHLLSLGGHVSLGVHARHRDLRKPATSHILRPGRLLYLFRPLLCSIRERHEGNGIFPFLARPTVRRPHPSDPRFAHSWSHRSKDPKDAGTSSETLRSGRRRDFVTAIRNAQFPPLLNRFSPLDTVSI